MGLTTEISRVCFSKPPTSSLGIWLGDHPTDGASTLLMIQISVIVVTSYILRYALRPLGQPVIVSQILTGILLGPTALGKLDLFKNVLSAPRRTVQLKVIGYVGYVTYQFMIGLKTDIGSFRTLGKNALVIGTAGCVIPLAAVAAIGWTPLYGFGNREKYGEGMSAVPFSTAVTFAPASVIVIFAVLSEKNLLNSKVGRLAVRIGLVETIVDTLYKSVKNTYFLSKSAASNTMVGEAVCCAIYYSFLFCLTRPLAYLVLRRTTSGDASGDKQQFNDTHFTVFLVLMFGIALASSVIGQAMPTAAFFVGLVLPSGPTLGSPFVERLDVFTSMILVPVFVSLFGLQLDMARTLSGIGVWPYLQFTIGLVTVVKIACIFMLSVVFFRIPWNNTLALAIVLSSKGITEVSVVYRWADVGIDDEESWTLELFNILVMAAVPAVLLQTVYRPSKRYKGYKRRSIQGSNDGGNLRLLACFHQEESAAAVINFLEVLCTEGVDPAGGRRATSNAGTAMTTDSFPSRAGSGSFASRIGSIRSRGSRATRGAPEDNDALVSVFVLHLIELMGSIEPVYVPYTRQSRTAASYSTGSTHRIFNAFEAFTQRALSVVSVNQFLGVSPYASMYEDICATAVDNKTNLVLLPFHRASVEGVVESDNQAIRAVNQDVIRYCPCSTAIFIDRGYVTNITYALGSGLIQTIVVYFLGGADDREALALALRMGMTNRRVSITMVRFLPLVEADTYGPDDADYAAKMDEQVVQEFKAAGATNSDLIGREERIRNGEELFDNIQATASAFDFVIIGRRSGATWAMLEGLSNWAECPELGIVGDFMVNDDAVKHIMTLVVQYPVGGKAT